MAKEEVQCATEGCEGRMTIVGRNRRDADYRAKKMRERGWTCRDCDNREAVARAEASGLPPLEGTEKQIAWAATLRESTLSRVDQIFAAARSIRAGQQALGFYSEVLELANLIFVAGEPAVCEAIEAMRTETDARFWIDGRLERITDRLSGIVKRLADESHALSPEGKAEAAAEQAAMEEATLRPATPVSETIAELAFRDGQLVARYDERSEPFNAALKSMGYHWDAATVAWVRRHQPAMMGRVVDRLAETAHQLIAAGIVVALHDTEARAKAIDGSFEPEHRRWVSLVPSGTHEGKLRFTWGRDEDLYTAFRGLPGASYRDKNCLVPATSRDEILDFAEAHGFRITIGAQARMDEVLAQRERGVIVDAKARPKPEPVEAKIRGARPTRLTVPVNVEVDGDLVDND